MNITRTAVRITLVIVLAALLPSVIRGFIYVGVTVWGPTLDALTTAAPVLVPVLVAGPAWLYLITRNPR